MLVGICGRAGSGKTTLANKIAQELNAENIPTVCYSGDLRFFYDSETRRKWLSAKWRVGLSEYIKAVNQFNWWNFEKIKNDLSRLAEGHALTIENAYDRKSGKKNLRVRFPEVKGGVVLYENCVLGGHEILGELDFVVLLNTSEKVCLERVIAKDSNRRGLTGILSRFLITTYSENIFFDMLLNKFRDKMVTCDSDGRMSEFPHIEEVTQIPVPLPKTGKEEVKKGTVFCDLDGTIIKHVPVPTETGEEILLLEGSVEKLKEWRKKGYLIILCTSRQFIKTFGILNKLRSKGIIFDQVICDLPVGPRFLINDSKGKEVRAIAIALDRDNGIGSIELP
jgi:uridine kinase